MLKNINFKKVGLVFLVLLLVALLVAFYPLAALLTYYLVQGASLLVQLTVAILVIFLSIQVLRMILVKAQRKVVAQRLKVAQQVVVKKLQTLQK